ncbi:hypothetical protein V2J09_023096 [Rumex salicifolius]
MHKNPPRITEIQVRIDCKGCEQKIKKALHGINGIYDIYIDLPQQKLTIIGWVDPEKIIKAIKKTKKTATICSHFEVQNQQLGQPIEQPPNQDGGGPPQPQDGGGPPPPQDGSGPPPSCGGIPPPPPEQSHPPQPEQPRDYHHRLRQQQPLESPRNQASPQQHPPNHEPPHNHPQPQVVEEVRVIHHHTPGYGPSHDPRTIGHNLGHDPGYNPVSSGQYSQGHRPQLQPQIAEEVHVIQHPDPRYRPVYDPRTAGHSQGYGPSYNPGPSIDYSLPQPVQVQHYHQYMPAPYVTQYEYASLSRPSFSSRPYARMDNCYNNNNEDYHTYTHNNNNGYDRSVFNGKSPNVCTIS